MTLKRRLYYSFLIAVALMLLSLLYRTGSSSLEPMPYTTTGDGQGQIVSGVIAQPTCGLVVNLNANCGLAARGWPLSVVSLGPDDDRPQNYYRGIQPSGLLGDLALYFVVSFGLLWLFAGLPKRRSSSK